MSSDKNRQLFADLLVLNGNLNVLIKDTTESTNLDAKHLGEQGEKDSLIVAFSQTSGRGRKGRNFFSPENTGIYFSLLLHPKISAEDTGFLTTAAAVYTAKAIEQLSNRKTEIKWVNDIFIDSKKVCGILCESAFKGKSYPEYIIIGIGINLYQPKENFPEYIKDTASSVFGETEHDTKACALIVSKAVNSLLDAIYNNNLYSHIREYKQRNFLLGKTVKFVKNNKELSATVTGLDDKLNLLVKTADGKELSLFEGDVTLKY